MACTYMRIHILALCVCNLGIRIFAFDISRGLRLEDINEVPAQKDNVVKIDTAQSLHNILESHTVDTQAEPAPKLEKYEFPGGVPVRTTFPSDDCEDAPLISVFGMYPFNLGTLRSIHTNTFACADFHHDAWWCFRSPETTRVLVNTCEGPTHGDTSIAVYPDCNVWNCEAQSREYIGCSNDSKHGTCIRHATKSSLQFQALKGQMYAIRVASHLYDDFPQGYVTILKLEAKN